MDLERGSGSIEGERGYREPGMVIDLLRFKPGLGKGGGPITSRWGWGRLDWESVFGGGWTEGIG